MAVKDSEGEHGTVMDSESEHGTALNSDSAHGAELDSTCELGTALGSACECDMGIMVKKYNFVWRDYDKLWEIPDFTDAAQVCTDCPHQESNKILMPFLALFIAFLLIRKEESTTKNDII